MLQRTPGVPYERRALHRAPGQDIRLHFMSPQRQAFEAVQRRRLSPDRGAGQPRRHSAERGARSSTPVDDLILLSAHALSESPTGTFPTVSPF